MKSRPLVLLTSADMTLAKKFVFRANPSGLLSPLLNVALVDITSGTFSELLCLPVTSTALPHCGVRAGTSLVFPVSLIDRESHLLMVFLLRF